MVSFYKMSSSTESMINSLVENIKKGQVDNEPIVNDHTKVVTKPRDNIRGKPKSGRFWKSQKER